MNMGAAAYQRVKRLESSTILEGIGNLDKSAVKDCMNTYGNLIWGLAKRSTNSTEEAEAVTLKIFNDIWNGTLRFKAEKCTEEKYVLRIAFRRLIKQSMPKA